MESAYTKFRGYASGTPNFLTFCPSPFDFLFILYLLLACNFPFNCLSSSQVRKSTVSLFGLGWSHFRNWIWWTSNVTVTVKIQRFFDYTATPPHTGLSKLVFNTNWQKTWELISQNLIGIDTHVHKGITVSQFEPFGKKIFTVFLHAGDLTRCYKIPHLDNTTVNIHLFVLKFIWLCADVQSFW